MKTIVVGYDETDAAKRALERAADIAEKFGATLIVTSVAGVLAPAGRSGGGVDPVDSPAEHEQELDHVRAYLQGRGLSGELQPAIGDAVDAIIEVAEQRNADMIVVGTREPGFVERLFGHSVSAGVARRAHCDVLIVH